jgi:hypothetical protein
MKVKCFHCKREFSIARVGESDVKQYTSTVLHKDMMLSLVQASKIDRIISLFVKEGIVKSMLLSQVNFLYDTIMQSTA